MNSTLGSAMILLANTAGKATSGRSDPKATRIDTQFCLFIRQVIHAAEETMQGPQLDVIKLLE